MSTDTPSETWASLQALLKTFVLQISEEFRFFSLDEKAELMVDTLRNKALKQYLMYVADSRVVLSTVHGSKGLEWDYVILPDMERDSFPHYLALCKDCRFRRCCQLDWKHVRANGEFENRFRQELNLFYVGGTRARRKAYFTYSDSGLNWRGDPRANCPSCFLRLDGLHGAAIEE